VENLIALLTQIREHYLGVLTSSLKEFQHEFSPAAPELLLEVGRETAYAFRLFRIDMASNVGGQSKMQDVNPSTHLNFPPQSFAPFPGLALTLNPIAWNGVDFTIHAISNWDGLEEWTLRWLDVDDSHPQDENGLQGVIHSVTTPEVSDGSTAFSVDFGSAPVAAFEELLQLLVNLGAKRVEMDSSCLK
jgi:hypothetical protein